VRIKIVVRDKVGKDFEIQEIKRLELAMDIDLERIAKECEKIIQETIMTTSENPTGHLASLMLADKIENGWGVGDIELLDNDAPYWNHIDKGSEGIGANWSHFLPKGFWSDGRWVESDTGFAGVKPNTPITAKNYIALTLQQMESIIPKILKGR